MKISVSEPPLIPDGDQAREWAERELLRPEYAEAEPTPIDRIAQGIRDFFADLFNTNAPDGVGTVILIVAAVAIVAAIVVAFIVWGRPRSVQRASTPFGALFGDDDARSARELRESSRTAADAGDWDAAIILRFRALARALVERGVIDLGPGATAHTFGERASRVFPDARTKLQRAAATFDDVRYLRRRGTREALQQVAETDDLLATMLPSRESVIV